MKRLVFHIALIFALTGKLQAQTYPVQANLQITPPFSTFLSDYTAPGSNRLVLNTFLADLTRPQLQVRFRLKIEGVGISLRTNPGYIGAPFFLESGFPLQISGSDLAEYFNLDNLEVNGVSKNQLRWTGALPEGIYQFSIEILEYNRGVQISNAANATAWLILNDPPVINMPFQKEVVSAGDPQTIRFQWTPRHTGSPNSAFTTNYEFKLVEIWPESRNPNDAMLTTSPLFTTELTSTSFVYGLAEPPLIPGRKYAFQIKAKAAIGIESLELFKNEGKSEVHSFTFGEACLPPTLITGKAIGNNKLKLNWVPAPSTSSVAVLYRETRSEGYFFEEDSYVDGHTVYKLKQNRQYEVVLRSQCGTLLSPDSESLFIKTGNDTTVFACGNLDVSYDLSNKDPIDILYPGDTFYAGDFDVRIDSIYEQNGKFSGGGIAVFPFLNFVSARVVFSNVLINTDFRMTEGNITSFYNPNSAMMADLDDPNKEFAEVGDVSTDEDSLRSDNPEPSNSDGTVVVDSVYTNEEGEIVVVANGEEQVIEVDQGEQQSYTDAIGNTITVDENGITTSSPNTVSGSSNSGVNGSSDEFTVNIGPLTAHIKATDAPSKDEGKCIYDKVEVSFELLMEDESTDLQQKIQLEGGVLSIVKDCETDKVISLNIDWHDDDGYDIGKVAYLGAKVLDVHLVFAEDELREGEVTMEVNNDVDIQLNPITVLRAGTAGKFTYQYDSKSRDYTGTFDFGGIKNVNIDVLKAEKTIASLKDGEFNKEGWLKGHLDLLGPVKYQTGAMEIKINKFKSDIEFSMSQGFNMISGDIRFELMVANLKGSIKGLITVDNNKSISELTSVSLSAFGMTFTDVILALKMEELLDFKGFAGTLKATHPEFGTTLDILNFEIDQGALVAFSGAGSISYNELAINVEQITYDAQAQLLRLNAYVEQNLDGILVAAEIDDFTVDMAGGITMGDYYVDVSGVRTFGPLSVALSATSEGSKKNKWISTEAEASFSLQVEDGEEIQVTKAKIIFEKKKGKSQYRNISIELKDRNLASPNIGPLKAYLEAAFIKISHEGEFISGEPADAGDAHIGEGSYLDLRAELNKEVNLGGIIFLDKGVTGFVRFNFSGEDLEGSFNYEGIEHINLSARKGDQSIARLSDGKLNSEGILRGKLSALEGSEFKSGMATVKVEQLDLDVAISFLTMQPVADILSGSGLLTVSHIKGVNGAFGVGINFDDQANIAASLSNNSEVSVMGLQLSSFEVNVAMNSTLDIQSIEGQMKGNHNEFDATLIVNEFSVKNGELVKFNIEGKVNYNGFFLDIDRALYTNESLVLDGKVALNVTGSSAWLEVKEFGIDATGVITIKQVAGELNKSPVLVKFSAGFAEEIFKGTFTGKLATVGLAGKIDIGVENSQYNFAYLELTAKTNIPLGGTGLKLTNLGGQLGYNYVLKYKEGSTWPEGQPQEGNYIIGLTLGVADVADMAELTGNPLLQFGKSNLSMTLNGKLQIPRVKPVLSGKMNVNYKLPENTISGSLEAELNVPPQSGKAVNGQFDMDFNIASETWSVNSNQMTVSLLEQIDFNGNLDLNGKIGKDGVSGYLSGSSSYDFTKDYEFEMFSVDFKASVAAGFNFQGRISMNDVGLNGAAQVKVYVNGELGAIAPILEYTKLIELSGTMSGALTFDNTSATIEGKLTVTMDVFGDERSVDVDVIKTI